MNSHNKLIRAIQSQPASLGTAFLWVHAAVWTRLRARCIVKASTWEQLGEPSVSSPAWEVVWALSARLQHVSKAQLVKYLPEWPRGMPFASQPPASQPHWQKPFLLSLSYFRGRPPTVTMATPFRVWHGAQGKSQKLTRGPQEKAACTERDFKVWDYWAANMGHFI